MDEIFTNLTTLKTRYENDIVYLQNHFEGKLLTQLQEKVFNYYNELFNQELKNVEKYSSFNMQLLGPVLASIATVFEGHQFVCQDVVMSEKSEMDGYYNHIDYLMLVSETNAKDSYSKENIEELIESKQLFLIKRNYFSSRTKKEKKSWYEYEEKFYTFRPYINESDNVRSLLDNTTFPYIKEFMDLLIKYRVKNNLLEIKQEDILVLRKEFIKSHLPEINQKLQEQDALRTIEIQKQIELLNAAFSEEKRTRKLYLDNILNN